jgi:hypothetical protein
LPKTVVNPAVLDSPALRPGLGGLSDRRA